MERKSTEEWQIRVSTLLMRDYAVSLADVGLDREDIERYSRSEPDPRRFVEWLASKFDLTSRADVRGWPLTRAVR